MLTDRGSPQAAWQLAVCLCEFFSLLREILSIALRPLRL